MNILKNAFEAVRKIVKPTPEERAEQDRAIQIDELELQLEYAKKGFKPSQDTEYYVPQIMYGLYAVQLIPVFDQADWSAEEQAQAVHDITARLKGLGVSDERIEELNNNGLPARHVILNYKKEQDEPHAAL